LEELSYKNAGVDIDAANEAKKAIAKSLTTDNKRVLNRIGAFASIYNIKYPEIIDPVLVLKTEEPGSKQLLAFKYGKIESICYDMINHLINDCIVMGAKPLSVQDAIICGKLDKPMISKLVESISKACVEQDCILTGGETSEQPGVLREGQYILTSSIVGIADKKNIIDGSKINEGDVVIAIESSGLHTNGYTLIRKMIDIMPNIIKNEINSRSFLDHIMEPHRCYYKTIRDLFPKQMITGMAHITGGGIQENLNRILPTHLNAEIDLKKYQISPVFKFIKKKGNISDRDMLRTFNLGVGFILVVSKNSVLEVLEHINSKKVNCYEIGKITPGNQKVCLINKLAWL
jgi:phosphoribosylformylglycinamidine cyclo-ligase